MSQLHDVTRAIFRYPHTHLIQVLQQIRQLATNLDAVDPVLRFPDPKTATIRNISGGRKSICAIGTRPIPSPGAVGIFSVYSHRFKTCTPNPSINTAITNPAV